MPSIGSNTKDLLFFDKNLIDSYKEDSYKENKRGTSLSYMCSKFADFMK